MKNQSLGLYIYLAALVLFGSAFWTAAVFEAFVKHGFSPAGAAAVSIGVALGQVGLFLNFTLGTVVDSLHPKIDRIIDLLDDIRRQRER